MEWNGSAIRGVGMGPVLQFIGVEGNGIIAHQFPGMELEWNGGAHSATLPYTPVFKLRLKHPNWPRFEQNTAKAAVCIILVM